MKFSKRQLKITWLSCRVEIRMLLRPGKCFVSCLETSFRFSMIAWTSRSKSRASHFIILFWLLWSRSWQTQGSLLRTTVPCASSWEQKTRRASTSSHQWWSRNLTEVLATPLLTWLPWITVLMISKLTESYMSQMLGKNYISNKFLKPVKLQILWTPKK